MGAAVEVRPLVEVYRCSSRPSATSGSGRWPRDGVPPNPGAWLTVTARNRALDRLRRERTPAEKARLLDAPRDTEDDTEEMTFPDERLELIFTRRHPALGLGARVALTLRALGGLRTEEIARAFLLPEETMKRRLARAKRKIRDGELVLLADQDRSRWDAAKIARGALALERGRALQGRGVYLLQAAIAVAEAAGTQSGLELVDRLDLGGYRYFHSTRADLLRRRVAEASGSR
ncbi:MAG TPA: sigma factor-like helix-turn-helix DNA-binding protein [Gaiellales bacterium]|jgi:predicted RNA polymerase sigma factor|nr:sigma factor-like helix-turn-helix DNA-binding protein [Gaiellales bacterium]